MTPRIPLLAAILALCAGCQTARFYSQAVRGQWEIVTKREPIESLIDAPATPPHLRHQLQLVRELCAFAAGELSLPAGGQYTHYTDLGRPFVVWNIHAAPAFSLEAKSWWYPFVGRLEYQGYFKRELAANYVRRLREDGLDVFAGGVTAYSTLGWFNDPVLNTFIDLPEAELADLIFHELAHKQLFIPGDTDFNEAFATAVAREGVRRWLQSRGNEAALQTYLTNRNGEDHIVEMALRARDALEALYATAPQPPPETLKRRKEEIIASLRAEYQQFRTGHPTYTDYDDWMAAPINNAQLNTLDTYYQLVPGFEAHLAQYDGNLSGFYDAVAAMKRLKKEERRERLEESVLALKSKPRVLPDEPRDHAVQAGGQPQHQPERPLAGLVTK